MMTSGQPDTRATRTRSAAPAGGAHSWGRGCALVMALSAAPVWSATSIETQSGQAVTLSEVLLDENPGELWVRFRFLAPEIARDAGDVDPDATLADMQGLCDQIAVPYLVDNAISPVRIVVSMSDRMVPFGQPDPDATQFFELFSLENGVCIWEEF